MPPQNSTLVNFAAGETSPKSRGRFDLDWYNASCEKMLNFVPEIQGPARFRQGLKKIRETRGGGVARLVWFRGNNTWYALEFTDLFMRVYIGPDEEILTTDRTTITAITQADPAVITVASTTNLADDDEIIITGLVGMTELNGRQVKLANNAGSTYELVDPTTGLGIDSTGFGVYSSGGDVVEVYEIASPYFEADLEELQWGQAEDGIMYFVHPRYAPYKLTVDTAPVFTLATYARTNDPFTPVDIAVTVTDISLGAVTVVKLGFGDTINPDILYTFSGVVGTTEINGLSRRLTGDFHGAPNPFPGFAVGVLELANGTPVDSSAWTPYISGGTGTPASDNPVTVAFYEGRQIFGGTNQRPGTIFGSRGPNTSTGAARYDDFTGGANDDDAYFFTLAPIDGQVDYMSWARASSRYLHLGTFGGPFRVSGGGTDFPITPSSINAKQIDTYGCKASLAAGGTRIFFIQRGGTALRSIKFISDTEDTETEDLTINAEHLAESPFHRVVIQRGRPDIVQVLRDDGVLVGMSVHKGENVTGWSRLKIAGTAAKVRDMQVQQRPTKNDQLWVVTERTIDGVTRRFVEAQYDPVDFPDFADFYTGAGNAAADLASFRNAVYRRQEEYVFLDAAATYDGSNRGATAGATLTPGATTGTGVTFTASASVFAATDVGNELWLKPNRDTGVGAGRAVITAYNSGTDVTADIIVDFSSTDAITAGSWHIAADEISGVWHLEGERVAVMTDGAVYSDGLTSEYPTVTVANGAITLANPAAVIHVGLPYTGFIKTQNLELGGRTGPAQTKPRNIVETNLRFLNTLGVDYGTDIYNLDQIYFREDGMPMDRPAPVFSGIKKLHLSDSWEAEKGKHVYIKQTLPLPCIVESIDVVFETGDDG